MRWGGVGWGGIGGNAVMENNMVGLDEVGRKGIRLLGMGWNGIEWDRGLNEEGIWQGRTEYEAKGWVCKGRCKTFRDIK